MAWVGLSLKYNQILGKTQLKVHTLLIKKGTPIDPEGRDKNGKDYSNNNEDYCSLIVDKLVEKTRLLTLDSCFIFELMNLCYLLLVFVRL